MRLLVTGASGFVGPYAIAAVQRLCPEAQIIATNRILVESTDAADDVIWYALDVTEHAAVDAFVRLHEPTHVLHLAGVTTIAGATNNPREAWDVNLHGTLNLMRALLSHAAQSVFVFAGSGQAYGDTARDGRTLSEDDLLRPNTDYAATKAAADLAIGAMAQHGVRVVRMRPFNHTGPGQPPNFVIPGFADQIARIEAGLQPAVLRVGNIDVERDFLDVRDVADAYALALKAGQSLPKESVLNIASGTPVKLRALLDTMVARATVPIAIETDPSRIRANEVERFVGSARRLHSALGWEPRTALAATIDDMLVEARIRHGLREPSNGR
jgi:GDP-4-dehydro-6-deoxy-D-mannose reductase